MTLTFGPDQNEFVTRVLNLGVSEGEFHKYLGVKEFHVLARVQSSKVGGITVRAILYWDLFLYLRSFLQISLTGGVGAVSST